MAGNTTNSTLTMDPKAAAQKLQALNASFNALVRSVNSLVTDLNDLQANFYSPTDGDSTKIYQECDNNLGQSKGQTGLIPSIESCHQWCSAVDAYVQNVIRNQTDNNPYT